MISKKQIILILILLTIGYMYSNYNKKVSKDVEIEERDLIQKFLASDVNKMDRKKPFLWIHIEYDINERHWLNFGSRNTTNLNMPYFYLTIRSIIEKCGDSFNICLIDDNVFNKLIPGWSIHVNRLSSPLRPHMRELAMAQLLNKYGGIRVPPSFICFEDLITLYELGVNTGTGAEGIFVGEMVSTSIMSSSIKFAPCTKIMGCRKENPIIKKYIEYLETLVSSDYTEEMDFDGKISKWFFNEISKGRVNVIKSDLIGTKKSDGSPIIIDELMSDSSDIDLPSDSFGLYIPAHELVRRRNFGWFVRMSPEQVLQSNTQIAKYLLANN
jgi:hypothetical protein